MATEPAHDRTSEPQPSGEVGVLIARQVDPGHEADFERWAHGILGAAAAFPGHLGYGLFRPARRGDPWFLVHRFQDARACAAWQNSPERAAWFARADSSHREIHRRHLSGLEGWFPQHQDPSALPARWKMTLTAALGIFPVSLLAGAVLQPVLSPVPLLLRTALVALFFSGLMTFALMPALTRLLRRWLYPR